MQFISTNPHPKGKKIGDCVVRAISIAETRKWTDVFDAVCSLGRELHNMPNSKMTYEEYLLLNGWKKQKMPKHPNGKKFTVEQLAERENLGKVIVSIPRHLTVIVNGDLHDTWDCRRKYVGNYFIK